MLANAIRLPSGDQAGSESLLSYPSGETRRSSLPSALITWMLSLPSRKLPKEIWVPSGDQEGCCSSVELHVSRATPVPSGATEYSSWPPLPSRLL